MLTSTRWAGLGLASQPARCPPWRLLIPWLGVALAVRVAAGLGSDFVLHPDEIMQYLEPAHAVVFGNGGLFWEFHFGGRSWLVPGLVAGLLLACKAVGLGEPWFYVGFVKFAFCLLSLAVPWGAYRYCRHNISERAARLALVLTCLWPYLVGFAHKPFTEFVATHLLFAALGLASPLPARALPAIAPGALLALAALVRFQYLPVVGLVGLACLPNLTRAGRRGMLAGVALGGILVAALETLTWGSPWHSYVTNFTFNQHLDGLWSDQPWHFHASRLVHATAGGVLVGAWAVARDPRRLWLPAAAVVVTLALHAVPDHKEFRFVNVTVPFAMVTAAAWLAARPGRRPAGRGARQAWQAATVAAGLSMLTLTNTMPGAAWLHTSGGFIARDEVDFLRDNSNMWAIYRDLAARDDVRGVFHVGDHFANTPGYYHLHHAVPLYDNILLTWLYGGQEDASSPDLHELVSHVVTREAFALPGFELESGAGDYLLYTRTEDGPVILWEDYRIYFILGRMRRIALSLALDHEPIPEVKLVNPLPGQWVLPARTAGEIPEE